MAPWTVARKTPLSVGFSRQEYWSGLPLPPQGDLPDPGIEHMSPAWQADSLPLSPGKPLENLLFLKYFQKTLPRSCMCGFLSSYYVIPEMPSLHTPSYPGGSLLIGRIQFKATLTQPGLRSSSSGPPANSNRTYHLLFWLVLYDSSLIEYKLWGPFIHIYHSRAFSVLAQTQEVARTKHRYKCYWKIQKLNLMWLDPIITENFI